MQGPGRPAGRGEPMPPATLLHPTSLCLCKEALGTCHAQSHPLTSNNSGLGGGKGCAPLPGPVWPIAAVIV